MNIKKQGDISLNLSAYDQETIKTEIVFWDSDIDTAVLHFYIKHNNDVVPLASENIDRLISYDDIVDSLTVIDHENGVLEYTVPKEILDAYSNKTITAQLYICVDNTTVTTAEIQISIKNAVINQISSTTKIAYIRMFDDLYHEIKSDMEKLKEEMAVGTDYVAEMVATKEQAEKEIDDKVSKTKTDIDAKVNTATTNLNKTATDATKAITDTAKSATDSVDADLKEFKDTVANNGFLKPSDVANYQKYALTGADGVAKRISGADCNTLLDLGFYYLPSPINQPSGWGGLYLIVIPGSTASTTSYYKQIGFQYATGKIATRDRKSGPMSDNTLWTDWTIIETEAGSAQKVATLKDLLLKLAPTSESAGVKLSINTTDDVLTAFTNAPQGVYGVYVQGGAANGHPNGGACRGIVLKSSPTIGFIQLVNTRGELAVNYMNDTLGWSGWKTYGTTDTGWLTLTLKNGAIPFSDNSVPKYRLITSSGITRVLLKGAVKGITSSSMTIAQLPSSVSGLLDMVRTYSHNTNAESGKAQFNRLSIQNSGEIQIEYTTKSSITSTDWIPIDFEFTV